MASPCSIWSVASTSMSKRIVSSGGPFRRRTSDCAASAPAARAWRVRVIVSGLYWKITMLASGLKGSSPTMAPFSTCGEPGNAPMAPMVSGGPSRPHHGAVTARKLSAVAVEYAAGRVAERCTRTWLDKSSTRDAAFLQMLLDLRLLLHLVVLDGCALHDIRTTPKSVVPSLARGRLPPGWPILVLSGTADCAEGAS